MKKGSRHHIRPCPFCGEEKANVWEHRRTCYKNPDAPPANPIARIPYLSPEERKERQDARASHREDWKKRCAKRGLIIKDVRISVPAAKPEDLYQRVKALSVKHCISIQKLLIKAIESYVSFIEKRDKEREMAERVKPEL